MKYPPLSATFDPPAQHWREEFERQASLASLGLPGFASLAW